MAGLSPVRGREHAGRRSVLVLSHDVFNGGLGPSSPPPSPARPQHAGHRVALELTTGGPSTRCWRKISQVRTLSVERIDRRPLVGAVDEVNRDPQPRSLERTLAKLAELPRRSNVRETGFDALGVLVVRGTNTGTPFALVIDPPAPQPGEPMHYDGMIARVAHEYDTTFAAI